MPWTSETPANQIDLPMPLGVDIASQPASPPMGPIWSSAFDQNNVVANVLRRATRAENPVDLSYNPYADTQVKGTKYESQYGDRFTHSYSQKDTAQIISDIDREEQNNETLAAGGWKSVIPNMLAGVLDPTILIPGGVVVRGAKGGYSVMRSALAAGTAAATQSAIQESVLQNTQETRSGEDSVLNIGSNAILAAILGVGASSLLKKGEADILRKSLDSERANIAGAGMAASAGAAATDMRTGVLRPLVPEAVSNAYQAGKQLIAKTPVVGPAIEKVASFPEWLATKNSPLLRMATSESTATRRAVGDLAVNPLETVDNSHGIVGTKFDVPLEMDVKLALHQAQVDLYDAVQKGFSDYRFKGQVALPGARSWMERKFGRDGMTQDEFLAEVDNALRNSDKHEIPAVQELAGKFRKWLDIVKNLAKTQGIDFGDEVLGASSFAPRVIDRQALTAKRPEFVNNYVSWRKGDQAKKASLQQQVSHHWDIMRNARIQSRKIEGRLETADKRIAHAETRLSERKMEATATVKRSMTLQDHAREMGQAKEDLNSFVKELKQLDTTPEIAKQISDLERGIKELDKGGKPITEADLAAIDKAESQGILTGPMRRVANILIGKGKPPKPPSFWKYVADVGNVRDYIAAAGKDIQGKNLTEKIMSVLQSDGGIAWGDLQEKLMTEFPELRAQWDRPGLAKDHSDEIRDLISRSLEGKEPGWFLDQKWSEDDRFVAEWSALLDHASHDAGVTLKTREDVADFMRSWEGQGLSEADFEKMQADIEDGSYSLAHRGAVEELRGGIEIRKGTMAAFRASLKKAERAKANAGTAEKVGGAKAKEAGIATNRNLGRTGLLNERVVKAEQVKMALGDAHKTWSAAQADAMSHLEELLQRWDGNSSKAAKAAMERRALADAERSAENKAKKPRLEMADSEINKAVRNIIGSATDKSDQELVAEAEQTINQYLSTPDGRLPKDEPGTVPQGYNKADMGNLRGSLNARKNPMPDSALVPFLIRNPLDYTLRYLKQGLSDLGMVARYGDTEGTQALKDIADEYAARMRQTSDPKELAKLQSNMEKDIRDFAIIRDRIKGTYGFSSDAFMQQMGRLAETAKSFTVSTLGGGFGMAQFPDFAGVVFRHGLQSAFKDGWAPFFGKLTGMGGTGMKAAQKEWRAFQVGAETFLNTRNLDAMDITDVYHHRSPFERTMRGAGAMTTQLSGMDIVTDAQKVIGATVASNNILRAVEKVSSGKASARDIRDLAAGYIDEAMAGRIWKNFSDNGGNTVNGTYLPNLDDWKDQQAAKVFKAAVLRDVEIGVLTPGQEKPAFLSNPILSVFGQFKTFVAAANTRILLANLQRRDARTLSGLLAYLATGMMSFGAYRVASGQDLPDRPQDWLKEGIDRSGMLGWFGEMSAIASKATGGKADLYRLIGADKPLSRYASRGIIGNLLGPLAGTVENATGVTYDVSNGQWTESDTTRLRRLLPFQNLFYIRQLLDEVERNGNAAFGIEAKASNG